MELQTPEEKQLWIAVYVASVGKMDNYDAARRADAAVRLLRERVK